MLGDVWVLVALVPVAVAVAGVVALSGALLWIGFRDTRQR